MRRLPVNRHISISFMKSCANLVIKNQEMLVQKIGQKELLTIRWRII